MTPNWEITHEPLRFLTKVSLLLEATADWGRLGSILDLESEKSDSNWLIAFCCIYLKLEIRDCLIDLEMVVSIKLYSFSAITYFSGDLISIWEFYLFLIEILAFFYILILNLSSRPTYYDWFFHCCKQESPLLLIIFISVIDLSLKWVNEISIFFLKTYNNQN